VGSRRRHRDAAGDWHHPEFPPRPLLSSTSAAPTIASGGYQVGLLSDLCSDPSSAPIYLMPTLTLGVSEPSMSMAYRVSFYDREYGDLEDVVTLGSFEAGVQLVRDRLAADGHYLITDCAKRRTWSISRRSTIGPANVPGISGFTLTTPPMGRRSDFCAAEAGRCRVPTLPCKPAPPYEVRPWSGKQPLKFQSSYIY